MALYRASPVRSLENKNPDCLMTGGTALMALAEKERAERKVTP
jgi:hypothetical protein